MRLRSVLIGIAAGLCIGLGGAPEEAWALAWLGPGLLLLGIETWDGITIRPHDAFVMGMASGFATNAWTMRWAVGLFESYAMLPWVAAAGLASLLWVAQAAPWGIGCWLVASIRRNQEGDMSAEEGRKAGTNDLFRSFLPAFLSGSCSLLPLALLLCSSLTPMIFPWRPAVTQTGFLPFIQCAELGGPPLVDAFFLFGSCWAMQALRTRDRRVALAALMAIALPVAYGVMRIPQVRAEREAAPLLRIGLVQHGYGIDERLDSTHTIVEHRAMRLATAQLERDGADLVIWPESAYGFGWRREDVFDPIGDDGFFRDGVHGPLLVGAITGTWTQRWNSVLALERGRVTGVADKVHLMTFTEEVPLWDYLPPLQQLVPRGLSAGTVGSDVLSIAHTRIGVLNCFEDLVPQHAREVTGLGAEVLTNHTNDAWFGDTYAPHLHRFLSTMRAVETRRDLVRVVGTGPSGLTTALGERDEGTPTFVAATRLVEARPLDVITPWVAWGDLVTFPAITLLAVLAWMRRRAC
jgi:apolipoprotein N-acyltransferase